MANNIIRFRLAAGITKAQLVDLITQVYGYQHQIPEAQEQEFVTADTAAAQTKIAEIEANQWKYLGDFQAVHPQGHHHLKWIQPVMVQNTENRPQFAKRILKQEFTNLLRAMRERKYQIDASAAAKLAPIIEVEEEDEP